MLRLLDDSEYHIELLEAAEELREPALEAVLAATAAVREFFDELREGAAGQRESGIVRFCFAKQDQTLQQALQRLTAI